MRRRHTIFKSGRQEISDAQGFDPSSPIKFYMDESSNGHEDLPLLVGVLVTDIDADEIEVQVQSLYRRLAARRTLQGWRSFERFREKGFHAAEDLPEISVPFIELIQQQMGFKAYVAITDRRTLSSATEPQQIEYMYELLISDNLIRYRGHPEILCYIEENDALSGLTRSLPANAQRRATEKLGKTGPLPTLKVEMRRKQALMSIAIIDYIMMAVSRWARIGYKRDPSLREYRTFRQIEPTISLLYSLEDGVLSSRKVRFPRS